MARRAFFCSFLLAILAVLGASRGVDLAAQSSPHPIIVESPAFKAGEPLPKDYALEGRNVSPPLTWRNVPAGTKELAVLVEDPGGANPTPNVLWVLYKIPAAATGLPEGVPPAATLSAPAALAGAMQGVAGYGSEEPGYRGPSPPRGAAHHFRFIVYALDAALELHRVGPGRQVLQTLVDDRLRQHRRRGGSVAGHVVGLGRGFLQKLSPHVLEGVLQLDLLGHRHAVVRYRRRAPLLLEDDVAALRAEGRLYRVGENIDAFQHFQPGVLVETYVFSSHGVVFLS